MTRGFLSLSHQCREEVGHSQSLQCAWQREKAGHRLSSLLGDLGLENCHAQHATETTRHHEPMCKLTATHLQLYEARVDHRSTQLAHHRFSQQTLGATARAWWHEAKTTRVQQCHNLPQGSFNLQKFCLVKKIFKG